jgi:hypothetical protein
VKQRKQITLPSGGTCVVRKLAQTDLIACGLMPMFLQFVKQRPTKGAELTDEQTVKLVEQMAQIKTVQLTRCAGSILSDGKRYKIVDKPNLDEVGENEISIEEMDQSDAEAICSAVDELSGLRKEAAEAAAKFPAGQENSGGAAPSSDELRGVADNPAGTQPV